MSGIKRAADTARRAFKLTPIRVLTIYLVSRVYSTTLMLIMLSIAGAGHWPFVGIRGKPDFFVFSGSWDGWFYRSIAEHGYPPALPVDAANHVLPNEWAFLPIFPVLEHVVAAAFGLTTFTAGTLIAITAGAGSALILERLLFSQVGQERALRAVALFCFGPMAFVLQVAYAESVFLLLFFAATLSIQRSQYWTALPIVLVAAFTRPGAIAICEGLALQLAIGWYLRGKTPRRLGAAVVLIAFGALASVAWSPIADAATGMHGAYIATELSWWTGWVGRPAFVPFTPWFLITSRWLGPLGVIAAALVAIAFACWLIRRAIREVGPSVGAVSGAYLAYLVAVFLPQVSLPRLLMPLAPLLGTSIFTSTRPRALGWLVAVAAFQPLSIFLLWYVGYP